MKITRPPKRLWPPLPQVAQLIERVHSAPDEDLPSVLESVYEWPWPRGDLHHWAPTLNRFDAILENTLTQYGITDLQYHDFTPNTKRLIVSIIRFTRLLLESCTNRKIYNSYEHLRSLLVTNDLDVLEETLRLLLRPAQQHSSSGGSRAPELGQQSVVINRLLTLGSVFSPLSHGVSMVDLASESFSPAPEQDCVRLVVHRTVTDTSTESREKPRPAPRHSSSHRGAPTSSNPDADTSTSLDPSQAGSRPPRSARPSVTFSSGTASGPSGGQQPSQSSPPQETTSVIVLRDLQSRHQPLMDIVTDTIEEYKIPPEYHFELFQRVRTALSMYDTEARKKLLSSKLLALAVYGHVVNEWTAINELFTSFPELARQVGALVSPEHKIDRTILSSAFYALEGLVQFRSHSADVFTSIGVSVNHGALLQNIRLLSNGLELLSLDESGNNSSGLPVASGVPSPWLDSKTSLALYADSVFSLLGCIVSGHHASHVAMIVGAGVMSLLVRTIQTCTSRDNLVQRSVARALGLIDGFIYATQAAFTQFCDLGGPDVYVERIKNEVDYDIAHPEPEDGLLVTVRSEWAKPADNIYGRLSLPSSTLLRNILKSISHMITATGTEELRNLIETSLPESVIKIMNNRLIFGPQILAVAIGIIGNLVHNEPTSLVVVQEKKIPELLYDLITVDIEANFDLISTLPSVCSAFCLNESGLNLFNRRMVARKLMRLLLGHRHVEVLEDRDNAILFGHAIDELVRHQPSTRDDVLAGIQHALEDTNKNAQDLDRRMERHPVIDDACRQAGLPEPVKQVFDLEEVTQDEKNDVAAQARTSITLTDLFDDEDDRQGKKDDANIHNGVIAQMDVVARFMEGFFHTSSHCQTFVDQHGYKDLLKFYDAPALPYNFLSSFASGSLANLLVLMIDPKAHNVTNALMESAAASADSTKNLWDDKAWASREGLFGLSPADFFAPHDNATWAKGNGIFRDLVHLNTKLFALGELYQTFSYSSTRPPPDLLLALIHQYHVGTDKPFVAILGDLLRQTLWANLLLKAAAPPRLAGSEGSTDAGKVSGPIQDIVNQLPSGTGQVPSEPSPEEPGSSAVEPSKEDKDKEKCVREVSEPVRQNVKAMRYTMSHMAQSLKTIHREVVRLLFKTSMDPTVRMNLFQTLEHIAETMVTGLKWRNSGNWANDMAYNTVMMDWVDSLLHERKGTRITMNVALLYAFFNRGGVSALAGQFNAFLEHMDKFFPNENKKNVIPGNADEANSLAQACGGIHVCLRLMYNLVCQKAPGDALQISLLNQQFNSFNQDLMNTVIRLQIIGAVRKLWSKGWLHSMPLVIVRSLIKIILAVLGKEETKPETSSSATTPAGPSLPMLRIPTSSLLSREPSSDPRTVTGIPSLEQMFSVGDRSSSTPNNSDVSLYDLGFSLDGVNAIFSDSNVNPRTGLARLLEFPSAEVRSQNDNDGTSDPAINVDTTPVAPPDPGTVSTSADSTVSAPAPSSGLAESAAAPDPVQTSGPAPSADGRDVNAPDHQPSRMDTEQPSAPRPKGVVPMQMLADILSKFQEELCSDLVENILLLARTHEPLVFEARDALHQISDKSAVIRVVTERTEHARECVEKTDDKDLENRDVQITSIRVYLHFLAIVHNSDTLRETLDLPRATYIVNTLKDLFRLDKSVTREYIPHIFLIASEIYGWTETYYPLLPYMESIWKFGGAPDARKKADPSNELGAFQEFFLGKALSVLRDEPSEEWSRESLLATYRLLVVLTRRPGVASLIGHGEDELSVLVRPFKHGQPERVVPICQSYLVTILRHIIEQPEVLQQLMFQMIRAAVHATRTRHVPTNNLLMQVGPAVWRDPDAFLEVAKKHLKIVEYSNNNPSNGRLGLVDDDEPQRKEGETEPNTTATEPPPAESPATGAATSAALTGPAPSGEAPTAPAEGADPAVGSVEGDKSTAKVPHTTEISDHLIHFLISELTASPSVSASVLASETTEREAKEAAAASMDGNQGESKGKDAAPSSTLGAVGGATGTSTSPSDGASANKTEQPKPVLPTPEQLQADQQLYYNGFILQTLAELLSSYDCCKLSLMNYTRKRVQPPASAPAAVATAPVPSHPPAKLRGTTVSTLFHELVALGAYADKDWRKCKALSNWLMSVIVALTADTTSNVSLQDLSADVISVRKVVLDGLAKSIRDVMASSESLLSKGGKILVLSDLCHRLLTVKPNQGSFIRQNEDLSLHMAKLMLEKNFVLVLTTTISEVDPSLSTAKTIIKSVLKPLDCLTKVAIRMGRAEKKDSREDVPIELSSDDGSSVSSTEDLGGERGRRHETPDFYRNSSLGIHTGDLEPGAYEDDVEDDESGDEDEDIEMEEYDNEEPGSDVTSDSDDENESDIDEDLDVEEMSTTEEESSEDEDDHSHDHDHDHDHSEIFEDEWTEEDDDENEGSDGSGGELDIVIEHDGPGSGDRLVPTLEIDDDEMGRTELGSVFDSEGEEVMEADEEEGSSQDGYDVGGIGDLALDDAYATPSSNTLDLFGANWAWVNPPGSTRGGGANGAHFAASTDGTGTWRTRLLDSGSRRNAGQDDPASHPLLVDQSVTPDSGSVLASRPPGRRQRLPGGLNHNAMGLGYPSDLAGNSTMLLLETLLEHAHGLPRGDAVRFRGAEQGESSEPNQSRSDSSESERPKTSDPVSVLQSFKPMSTTNRWQQDTSLVNARPVTKLDNASAFRNELHAALLGDYWSAQEEQKKEQAKKEAEAKRKAEQEEEAKRSKEEEERAERESREAAAPAQTSDTEMVDASQTTTSTDPSPTEGAGEEQGERQTIPIMGRDVDITGSGMDPEFLLALPDDMRQEIVEQHLRERQAETLTRDQSATTIEPEFLAALPPEIRAEVIEEELRLRQEHQQERSDRGRQQREQEEQENASPRRSETVAQPLRNTEPTSLLPPSHGRVIPAGAEEASSNKNTRRDAIQLLDRLGVLTLVRLLFFPDLTPSQSGLHRVLASVSENSKTRTDVLRMLLSVLTEGTSTPAAVDKSYAAISNRMNQALATPSKGTKKHSAGQPQPPSSTGQSVVSPISARGEKAPYLMALRCIEALTHLVDTNPSVSDWFLKEELKPSKKGKGKEKEKIAGEPPIGFLLGLLERPLFLENSTLLVGLIQALHLITKPLAKATPPSAEPSSATAQPLETDDAGEADGEGSNAPREGQSAPTESSNEPTLGSVPTERATSDAHAPTSPGSVAAPPTAPTDGGVDDSMVTTGNDGDETMATETPGGAEGEANSGTDVRSSHIPPERLASVVRPLATPISSRGFQATLAVASNLSHIEGAKDVIRDAFMQSATMASQQLMGDLDFLLTALPPKASTEEHDMADAVKRSRDKLQSPALAALASPASAQAVLLRSLRALDYLLTGK